MIGTMIAKSKTRKAFNALNNRDVHSFLSDWHDDAIFIYPGKLSVSGTIKGKKAIREWIEKFFQQASEFRFTVKHICAENLFDMRGTNTIATQWDIEATNKSGTTTHNIGLTLTRLQGGKAMEVRDFLFSNEEHRIFWEEN